MPTAFTRVLGSGFVTGEHCVKNEVLSKICDTSDDWIRERTGIEQRYFVEAGTSTSDLGVRAARKALEDAKVSPEEIDYIVFATMTPDYYFPGCGGLLQANDSWRQSGGTPRSRSARSVPPLALPPHAEIGRARGLCAVPVLRGWWMSRDTAPLSW